MTKSNARPKPRDPEFDIQIIRKEIILYFHDLPDLIRADAVADDLANMAICLGKCFCWIEHRFSEYERPESLLDHYPGLTVGGIGQKLWDLGKELCARRGNESPLELKLARTNLRLRSLEQIVMRMGGNGL